MSEPNSIQSSTSEPSVIQAHPFARTLFGSDGLGRKFYLSYNKRSFVYHFIPCPSEWNDNDNLHETQTQTETRTPEEWPNDVHSVQRKSECDTNDEQVYKQKQKQEQQKENANNNDEEQNDQDDRDDINTHRLDVVVETVQAPPYNEESKEEEQAVTVPSTLSWFNGFADSDVVSDTNILSAVECSNDDEGDQESDTLLLGNMPSSVHLQNNSLNIRNNPTDDDKESNNGLSIQKHTFDKARNELQNEEAHNGALNEDLNEANEDADEEADEEELQEHAAVIRQWCGFNFDSSLTRVKGILSIQVYGGGCPSIKTFYLSNLQDHDMATLTFCSVQGEILDSIIACDCRREQTVSSNDHNNNNNNNFDASIPIWRITGTRQNMIASFTINNGFDQLSMWISIVLSELEVVIGEDTDLLCLCALFCIPWTERRVIISTSQHIPPFDPSDVEEHEEDYKNDNLSTIDDDTVIHEEEEEEAEDEQQTGTQMNDTANDIV